MNDIPDNPIDRLVQDWIEESQPGQQHLAALHERILEAVQREQESEARPAPNRSDRGRRGGWLWFAAGATVAATVCLVLFATGPRKGSPELARESPPRTTGLDERQLLDQARLFAQMNDVFSGRLAWIAESDGRVELGIEPSPLPQLAERRTVAVRLVVLSRAAGESGWRRCWATDLLSENEGRVELRPQGSAGRELVIWTLALPDGAIAIDTSLRLSSVQPEVVYSGVEQPGIPRPILSWKAEGCEYQVLQTVTFLPHGVG